MLFERVRVDERVDMEIFIVIYAYSHQLVIVSLSLSYIVFNLLIFQVALSLGLVQRTLQPVFGSEVSSAIAVSSMIRKFNQLLYTT